MNHIVQLNNRYKILKKKPEKNIKTRNFYDKAYILIIACILFYAFITSGTWSKSQSFTSARARFEPLSSARQAR